MFNQPALEFGYRKSARNRKLQMPKVELIIDNFAGGGGASLGIERALGRAVDYAVNHCKSALAMHEFNHPATRHYCESVWKVDPVMMCKGNPVGLAWFSPDCRHFSRAKGKKPVSRKIRCLAWIVIRWARKVRPRVIMLENVREFQDWGPLIRKRNGDDVPDPGRKGESFKRWVSELKRCGYQVEYKVLNAADYGAPTHRRRLFVIARCDGKPIVWPKPTHGPDTNNPYRTAAECIDWSIPCLSIFDRYRDRLKKKCSKKCRGKLHLAEGFSLQSNVHDVVCPICQKLEPRMKENPLAEKTLRRIALGIKRYVLESPKPFIVPVTHAGERKNHSLDDPFPTVTAANRGELALVTPHITTYYGPKQGSEFRGNGVDEPLRTQTTENRHGLVSATLVQTGYGEREGQMPRALDIEKPLGTVVSGGGKHGLVSALLTKYYGGVVGHEIDKPTGTVTQVDHHALTTANLVKIGQYGSNGDCTKSVEVPTSTIVSKNEHCIATTHLIKMNGTGTANDVNDPLHTVTSGGFKFGLVYAFLCKYFGTAIGCPVNEPMHTVTAKDRMCVITVNIDGVTYAIADIGMRMLQPRELARAQGFPDDYILTGSKSNQVAKIGNSVCPPIATALVKANW